MRDPRSLFDEVYEILNKSTPLKTDCGKLCNHICCTEVEPDSGMYLFPGEEIMFSGARSFKIITTNFTAGTEEKVLLLQCNGRCDRHLRPLSCRLFPLTPFITGKGILTVKMDPRAGSICPLARTMDRSNLEPEFIRNVRKVCQILMQNPRMKEFIIQLSLILQEFENTRDLFLIQP